MTNRREWYGIVDAGTGNGAIRCEDYRTWVLITSHVPLSALKSRGGASMTAGMHACSLFSNHTLDVGSQTMEKS